jgi:hypothetical protein
VALLIAIIGGAEGDRTPDLMTVRLAACGLDYSLTKLPSISETTVSESGLKPDANCASIFKRDFACAMRDKCKLMSDA